MTINVPASVLSEDIHYTHDPVDRAHEKREDKDWLESQMHHPGAYFVPMYQGESAFRHDLEDMEILFDLPHLREESNELILLGLYKDRPVFTQEISSKEGFKEIAFDKVRNLHPTLSFSQAAILTYARAMTYWHQMHQFCGQCGTRSEISHGGFVRVCVNCGHSTYPRVDPAVIVLILHKEGETERCLLAQHAGRHGTNMYSTLAGFVEPGESIEGAVRREMKEETSLVITETNYIASQPWPFPSSLMLGFEARTETLAFELDKNELSKAQWFTKEELRQSIEDQTVVPSGEDSIARFLIFNWLSRK